AGAVVVVEMDITQTSAGLPHYRCSILTADKAMAHIQQHAKARVSDSLQPVERLCGSRESASGHVLDAQAKHPSVGVISQQRAALRETAQGRRAAVGAGN